MASLYGVTVRLGSSELYYFPVSVSISSSPVMRTGATVVTAVAAVGVCSVVGETADTGVVLFSRP